NRALLFLRKAGTIILLAVVVVWLLGSLPPGSDYASEQTFLGRFGTLLAPLLVPAGFGFWQAAVALLCGLVAKETVVGTLGALYGGGTVLPQVLPSVFTPVSAYAFLLMTLLYLPCLATMAVIKQEAGLRWAVVSTVWSLIVGWSVATFFYQVARFVL
ncbi:MAG TPA: nucleoside recognition domain-containing protein, partial [bacterium]|nr:nucleoside recognition domain-containing protein [bacterium]